MVALKVPLMQSSWPSAHSKQKLQGVFLTCKYMLIHTQFDLDHSYIQETNSLSHKVPSKYIGQSQEQVVELNVPLTQSSWLSAQTKQKFV